MQTYKINFLIKKFFLLKLFYFASKLYKMITEEVLVITFGKLLSIALVRHKVKKRWLIDRLKEVGIIFTDTRFSNRCADVMGIEFTPEEKKAIKSILKKHKIEL